VLYGTAALSSVSGLTGASWAFYHQLPAMPVAFQSALSTGSLSFAVLATREFAVAPLFASLRASKVAYSTETSIGHGVPETAVAAALAGGGFAAYKLPPSTPRAPAALAATLARQSFTISLAACVINVAVNAAQKARVSLLRSYAPVESLAPSSAPQASTEDRLFAPGKGHDAPPTASEVEGMPDLFGSRSDRLFKSATNWVSSAVSSAMPFRRITDDEYEAKLQRQLAALDRELLEVRRERETLESMQPRTSSTK